MSTNQAESRATPFFYRFRNMRALLGGPDRFDELRRQEIYFPSPSELNDPLEGFKNVFWQGDSILWNNLLRHYVLCLMQNVMLAVLPKPENSKEPAEPNFIFTTEDSLSTPQLKEIFESICYVIFQHAEIAQLPELLTTRNSVIKRNELSHYLRAVHPVALNAIMSALEAAPLIPPRPDDDVLRKLAQAPTRFKQVIDGLNQAERENATRSGIAEAVCGASNSSVHQIDLIERYNGSIPKGGEFWRYVLLDYPIRHVDLLEQLLYIDWFTACFVKEPMHSAMWGVYGDSHKGACLKLRSRPDSNGNPGLKLKTLTGVGGSWDGSTSFHYSDVIHAFHPVRYVKRFIEIDFFRSLGRLTMPALKRWYTDAQGSRSPSSLDILGGSAEWRNQYWDNSLNAITAKTTDWRHENEHRVVLQSHFDLSERSSRKLKYDFADLQGIIFGTKTSTDDKLEIMKVIEERCRQVGRQDFEFMQATYSAETGTLIAAPLSLLKF